MTMRRKVNPNIMTVQQTQMKQVNSSNISMNGSFLHEGYQSYLSAPVSRCYLCKGSNGSALVSPCLCQEKLFHNNCLKSSIQSMIRKGVKVQNDDQTNFVKCQDCKQQIRFKQGSKYRVKNCSQIYQYCAQNKTATLGIVTLVSMLFAGVAIILLIQLGIISIDNANLAKYILMIAIAVACGVVIIVIVCCCIECIRVQQYTVSLTYNRDGKSQKSRRSRRDSYTRSQRSNNGHKYDRRSQRSDNGIKVVVVSIQ